MATITQGFGHAAVTQPVTNPLTPAAQAVAITDGEGNLMSLGAGGTLPISGTGASGAVPVSSGFGPVTSLSAVTAAGPATASDLGVVRSTHTMQTVVTGAPTGVTVNLEGSLDAVHWFTLASSTSTTGDSQTTTGKAVRYIRANLATLTGGTAPTVTALIASAQ